MNKKFPEKSFRGANKGYFNIFLFELNRSTSKYISVSDTVYTSQDYREGKMEHLCLPYLMVFKPSVTELKVGNFVVTCARRHLKMFLNSKDSLGSPDVVYFN